MPEMKYPSGDIGKWAFWKWQDIPDANDLTQVYLRRKIIFKTPLVSLFLHFIYMSDHDRDPHNHPWSFWSWIVKGYYTEDLYLHPRYSSSGRFRYSWKRVYHRRFSIHRMGRGAAHQIVVLSHPLITMVLTGRHSTQSWGFYTPHGYQQWRAYNRVKYGVDVLHNEFS